MLDNKSILRTVLFTMNSLSDCPFSSRQPTWSTQRNHIPRASPHHPPPRFVSWTAIQKLFSVLFWFSSTSVSNKSWFFGFVVYQCLCCQTLSQLTFPVSDISSVFVCRPRECLFVIPCTYYNVRSCVSSEARLVQPCPRSCSGHCQGQATWPLPPRLLWSMSLQASVTIRTGGNGTGRFRPPELCRCHHQATTSIAASATVVVPVLILALLAVYSDV